MSGAAPQRWSNEGGAGTDAAGAATEGEAVREMRETAGKLEKLISEAEEGVDDGTLGHFESYIRELNHVHAVERASSVVPPSPPHDAKQGSPRRRPSWNKALAEHIEELPANESDEKHQAAAAAAECVGGGADSDSDYEYDIFADVAPIRERTESFQQDGALTRAPSSAYGSAKFRSHSSLGGGGGAPRVVGSLTPEMALGVRRSSLRSLPASGSEPYKRAGSVVSFASNTGESGLLYRRPSSAKSFSSRNGSVARMGSAASFGSAGGRSRQLGDSSHTRVVGKVDYSALLNEQQEDLTRRRSSMSEYHGRRRTHAHAHTHTHTHTHTHAHGTLTAQRCSPKWKSTKNA